MAFSIGEFAALLGSVNPMMGMAQHEMVKRQCEVVEAEAKRVIGTYDYGWPQLAESTQEDRSRKGFAANEPLLRTGDMRDSIKHTVDGDVGYVFSNDPIAKWQELGTAKIPPRSFLAGASAAMEDRCHEIAATGTFALLTGALMRSPGRFLGSLAHIGEELPGADAVSTKIAP